MLHAKFQDHMTSSSGEEDYNNGHTYVYSPGAGADNPLGTLFCQKHEFSIKLDIYCKFFPINDFIKSFPHSNTYTTQFDLAVK